MGVRRCDRATGAPGGTEMSWTSEGPE